MGGTDDDNIIAEGKMCTNTTLLVSVTSSNTSEQSILIICTKIVCIVANHIFCNFLFSLSGTPTIYFLHFSISSFYLPCSMFICFLSPPFSLSLPIFRFLSFFFSLLYLSFIPFLSISFSAPSLPLFLYYIMQTSSICSLTFRSVYFL